MYFWVKVWQSLRMGTPLRSDRTLDVLLGAGDPDAGEGGEINRGASALEDAVYRRAAHLLEGADTGLVDTAEGLSGLERAPLGEPVLRACAGRTE